MKNKKNKISQRVNDVLENHKINDIQELKNITADEFLHWNDCGRKATEEIMDLMKSLNIKFKPKQIEIDYVNNVGVIEQANGTPTTIHYNKEINKWE